MYCTVVQYRVLATCRDRNGIDVVYNSNLTRAELAGTSGPTGAYIRALMPAPYRFCKSIFWKTECRRTAGNYNSVIPKDCKSTDMYHTVIPSRVSLFRLSIFRFSRVTSTVISSPRLPSLSFIRHSPFLSSRRQWLDSIRKCCYIQYLC